MCEKSKIKKEIKNTCVWESPNVPKPGQKDTADMCTETQTKVITYN